MNRTLDKYLITTLIHGGADGADGMAAVYALNRGIAISVYEANWKKERRAAGPIRNQRMLEEGRPDMVIAFPGGKGTADMVRRAKYRNVRVIEVTALTEPSSKDHTS